MPSDSELLRTYARERSEDAFAELVRRHINLVYSAACRRTGGDPHLAAEATQDVFLSLARHAEKLSSHPVLNAWLHAGTRNAAANLLRRDRRREFQKQKVQAMRELQSSDRAPGDWSAVGEVLDETLDQLNDGDRHAIVLRYFEDRSVSEVAAILQLTEDTARKRIDRALEKLRVRLHRRGIASTTVALAGMMTTQAVHAAPAGLAVSVYTSVTAAAAITPAALGFLQLMTTTKATALVTSVVMLLGFATVTYEIRATRAAEAATVATNRQIEIDAGRVSAMRAELASAPRGPAAVAAAVNPALLSGLSPITGKVPGWNDPKFDSARKLEAAYPEVRRAQIAMVKAGTQTQYEPLLRALKLSPDQIEQFLQISLNTWEEAGSHGVITGSNSYVFYTAENPITDEEANAQYLALLGPAGYEEYQNFDRSGNARSVASLVGRAAYAADEPLAPESEIELSKVIAANTPSYVAGRGINLPQVDWAQVEQQSQNLLSTRQRAALDAAIQQVQFNLAWRQAVRTAEAAATAPKP